MRLLANVAKGFRSLFRSRVVEREMDDELHAFVEASTAEKLRRGLSAEQAARAALIEIGSANAVKHQIRSAGWESRIEVFGQDMRYAVRTLFRSPGFALVAVLSLALGIGGNTAIFTLINQVLLRDLPVRDPQQLVAFGDSISGGVAGGIDLGALGGYFPWDFARQLEENHGPFQGIAAYGSFSNNVTVRPSNTTISSEPALLAPANLVSGNYFSVLGIKPLLGRTILSFDDATPGSGAVVDLSYHLWRQSFSSDPAIVGKTITINSVPLEVIGVMPEAFHGFKQDLEPTDLWTPISMQPVVLQQPSMLLPNSGLYFLNIFGRLSPQAATSRTAFAEGQNWLNQQVHAGVRANEGVASLPNANRKLNASVSPSFPRQMASRSSAANMATLFKF